jgi:hypothetical protein
MKRWLCFLLLSCAGRSIADETRYAGASMELGGGRTFPGVRRLCGGRLWQHR